MALSPEVEFTDLQDETEAIETSSTYYIDFETGELTNKVITGIDAIQQFVYMALRTERYAYPIYSHDVGNELQELLSDKETTEAYKEMEIPRLIEEALVYDDRISEVSDFVLEKVDDAYHVSFTVHSVEGVIGIEDVIGDV
ncbi:DUF2634 domain-containing protein [Terribacillus sp. 7520-G]|uniref:DUF2634 domain-containing protein n=1 Tax=Terribacillus TaxID=459532 RepID=UPI000BA53597|nr:DUF2634 domain-containing protein [Terribacillus sp. 7520-G]PAD38600.1 phage portal protein [Terribacillus sp. 7520-G]